MEWKFDNHSDEVTGKMEFLQKGITVYENPTMGENSNKGNSWGHNRATGCIILSFRIHTVTVQLSCIFYYHHLESYNFIRGDQRVWDKIGKMDWVRPWLAKWKFLHCWCSSPKDFIKLLIEFISRRSKSRMLTCPSRTWSMTLRRWVIWDVRKAWILLCPRIALS